MLEARDFIASRLGTSANVAIILGSGLSDVLQRFDVSKRLAYKEIPHWPLGTVEGHAGELALADVAGTPVIFLAGRAHLYEGFSAAEVAFPIRVLSGLGVRTIVVTNAAGSIREDLTVGRLVLIADHINLQGESPLEGEQDERWGTRFSDMTEAYSIRLRDAARRAAEAEGVPLGEGVYAGVRGPNFETPAEIRYLRSIGADMVGMSTVCEVIAARQAGLSILGISAISNPAAGLSGEPLSHEEVLAAGAGAGMNLAALLMRAMSSLAADARRLGKTSVGLSRAD